MQVQPMSTTLKKTQLTKRIAQPKPPTPAPTDEAAEISACVVLSDRDRDIVLRALDTQKPNVALRAAAKINASRSDNSRRRGVFA